MSVDKGLPSIVDPIFREGEAPSASRLELNDRLIRNISGIGSTRVSYRNGRILIGGGVDSKSSFTYLGAENDVLLFSGGAVKWSGRGAKYFTDGKALVGGGFEGAYVVVSGGTELLPFAVQIRVEAAAGPASAIFICGPELEDDGTYFFKTICTAYLENGAASFVSSRLSDFCLSSPI